MAKCASHKWTLMTLNGTSVYVICGSCGIKFPFPAESNGHRYTGFIPPKFRPQE